MVKEPKHLKKTSLNLDPELYRLVRIRAAEEGRKVREIVEEALRMFLAKKGDRHGAR